MHARFLLLTTPASAWATNSPVGRVSVNSEGDLLPPLSSSATISDDVFKSTVHRAVNRSGEERHSIPLFFGTDYDVRLEVRVWFARTLMIEAKLALTHAL